jgi:hypothetical protein
MIRKSVTADVVELSGTMREADRHEVEALAGMDPMAALTLGFFHSELCMTGLDEEGRVGAMWGIVPTEGGHGSIWLLSSPVIEQNVREYLTAAKPWLEHQLTRYVSLSNMVTDSNTVHKRLLKFLGFTFGTPIDNFGPGKVRAIPFIRSKACAHPH